MKTDDGRGDDHETLKPRISSSLYLTLIASGGGLVYGYYVGFIIARLGVLGDLDSVLHEIIGTGLVGAILGAAAGGWVNDCLGRKCSILIAGALIFIGAVLLVLLLSIGDSGLYSNYFLETTGNIFIAFGVGMASTSSPLYISESSPPKLRDILVSINFIFYGVGKLTFLYLYDDRENDAIKAAKEMYTCCVVGKESDALRLLIRSGTTDEDELSLSGSCIFFKIRSAWSNPLVRKQFVVGTCLQAAQQLVGINALIYCIPSIHRMIGFGASYPKGDIPFMKTSLWESFGLLSVPSGICCTFCLMERFEKRKMLSWSIYCVLAVLLGLSSVCIIISPDTDEVVSQFNRCSSYHILGQSSGACLIPESSVTIQDCYNVFALPVIFMFSMLMLSGSLEIIPWIMNSQMYPTEVRGIYGGTAAAANWTLFLIIIIFYFFVTKTQGPFFTCLLISFLCFFVHQVVCTRKHRLLDIN